MPDGTIRDGNGLPRGYWEAKDTDDDLERGNQEEKKAKGYPLTNIIFEDTRERGAATSTKARGLCASISRDSTQLVRLLHASFSPTPSPTWRASSRR